MHTQDRLGGNIGVPIAAEPQLSGRTRRATLHARALCSLDKAPRKTPEKLASPTNPGTRNRSHEKGRCQAVHFAPGRRLAPGADGVTVERPERAKAREDERP